MVERLLWEQEVASSNPAAPIFKMLYELQNPLPVVTPLGNGYVLYLKDGGMWENDIFTVVLEEGGFIKHFASDQITVWHNATFNIKPIK